MNLTLINPPLLGLKNDPFSSIPSIPVGITYIASYLRERKINVKIIDAFGENPQQKRTFKKYVVYGLDNKEIISRIPDDTDIVGISVLSGMQHTLTIELIKLLKNKKFKIIIGGPHATILYKEFLKAGAHFVILGEGEETTFKLINQIKGKEKLSEIDGIAYKNGVNLKKKFIKDLDKLPFPAIDLLPLQNYWGLGYAHGPVKEKEKYTFLITSRGCPFNCNFCAAPKIWQRKWRARSAKNVVDEIEYNVNKYGIKEFHIQDDNFTFKKERVIEICKEILKRNLKINWQLPAGIKIETIDEITLKWMKKSGCHYISFSPESGSKRVLKLMNKPFNFDYALKMLKITKKIGIKTQACFVLGYPGERKEDIKETRKYIKDITKEGIDEVALFIMSPFPGTYVFENFNFNFKNYEDLTMSPRWRRDYFKLDKIRRKLYFHFLIYKMLYHPLQTFKSLYNLFTLRFDTKMEMTLYRLFKTYF